MTRGRHTLGREAERTQTSARQTPEPKSFHVSRCHLRRRGAQRARLSIDLLHPGGKPGVSGKRGRPPSGGAHRPERPVPRGLLCSSSSFSYTFSSTLSDCSSWSFCASSCCLTFTSSCTLERPRRHGRRGYSRAGAYLTPRAGNSTASQRVWAGVTARGGVPLTALPAEGSSRPSPLQTRSHVVFTDTLKGTCSLTPNSRI